MQQKQLVTIISAVLISVGILSFAIYGEYFDDLKVSQGENENSAALAESVSDLDTDEDGLKNWEEVLWKTDPTLPDTDRDGMNDNDEVIAGRDPTVAGPGENTHDPITFVLNETGGEEAVSVDYLAADLLAEYAALKQEGLNPEAEKDILNKLIVGSTQGLTITTYGETDFNVLDDSTKAELEIYFNEIIIAFASTIDIDGYEVQLIQNAITNQDPSSLSKVDEATKIHDEVIANLLTIKIPSTLLEEHMVFTNQFHIVNESLKNLRQVTENPVLALASLQAYIQTEPLFIEASENLGAAFEIEYNKF